MGPGLAEGGEGVRSREGRKGPYLKGKGLFSGVKFTKGREEKGERAMEERRGMVLFFAGAQFFSLPSRLLRLQTVETFAQGFRLVRMKL